MRAEFLLLGSADKEAGVSLKAYVWSKDNRLEAVVSRMEPTPGKYGASAPWFVCSCWESQGLTVKRDHCAHIQCVEEAVAAAEPSDG